MSMYHFFADQTDISDRDIYIRGDDYNHIKNVLRMHPGEVISVSDGVSGKEYRCHIEDFTAEAVHCRLDFIKEADTELPVRILLFQSLPKSDKMEFVIQKAVELGAAEIIPVASERCVVKLDEKKAAAKVKRWKGIAEAAAKQSNRGIVPEVTEVMDFDTALTYAGKCDVRLIPYELAEDFEKTWQTKHSEKLTLMYAGSLYKGRRDPSILFDAVHQLINENKIDKDNIIIDFYGDETNLRELSQKYDIAGNVNIHGRITQGEVLEHQMNADVLLLISWMNESEKMFIPGKVYDCIGCEKPILSIGYPEGSLKDLITKTNIGYHVSDVKECKKAIYDYYTKYDNNELNYCGNEFAGEYSLKNTAKRFAQILEEIQ